MKEDVGEIIREKKHIRRCIVSVTLLFVFSIWFGYYSATAYPEIVRETLGSLEKKVGVIFAEPAPWRIFAKIFLNNAITSFLALVLGIFLGVVPLFFIWANGYVIGMVVGLAPAAGFSTWKVIVALLPHGIIEFSAIIMATGYGLWLGYRFYRFLRHRDPFRTYLLHALRKYARIIIPLLFVAALIETFISLPLTGILLK